MKQMQKMWIGWLAAVVFVAAAGWAGSQYGAWYAAALAAVIVGAVTRRGFSIVAGGLGGLLSWGLMLAWMALREPVGKAARDVAAAIGVGIGSGAVVVVATLAVAAVLSLCGAWLGMALGQWVKVPT
jgi:hypothetical protein